MLFAIKKSISNCFILHRRAEIQIQKFTLSVLFIKRENRSIDFL